MVFALLMGATLIIGASGLLIRQLMARKLGSSESYQQMAEAAANNGLNRILGELNNPNPDQNRGFLFTLDNRENINEAAFIYSRLMNVQFLVFQKFWSFHPRKVKARRKGH